MNAVLSEKGRITIPREIRERLGLKPGTVLEFESRGGKLIAWKQSEEDAFEKWRGQGKLPVGRSVDEYLELIRHGNRD